MSLIKVFNNHLIEFLDDIISIFPNNLDIKTGKTFIEGIKKVNPKSLIQNWKLTILDVYEKQIMENDTNFFINKDYKNDLGFIYDQEQNSSQNRTMKIIEQIRSLVKDTSQENKDKAMKYVQNLTKICKIYFSN